MTSEFVPPRTATLPNVVDVEIFTDGGASPNPGPGGWAAILRNPSDGVVRELSGGEPRTTNNRMELTAAIRALEALTRRCRVRLSTDSQYLRRGVLEWLPGWRARGWKRKEGVLLNEDLWRLLSDLLTKHDIDWRWVKGHAGHQWNERADELATLAIRAIRKEKSGGGEGAPASEPAAPVDAEVFLRVACPNGKNGWAALVRHAGEEKTLAAAEPRAESPNQLDLLAAAAALEALPAGISVAVWSGSDYLRNGAGLWLAGWQRLGWKTKEGKPVKNRELWQRLAKTLATRKVTWPPAKDRKVAEFVALEAVAKKVALDPDSASGG